MTNAHIDASNPDDVLFHVKIDLGQSLLSPEEYWRTSNLPIDSQLTALLPTAERLLDGFTILANGSPLLGELKSWTLEATSLEAIENPLSPQMAILTYGLGRIDVDISTNQTDSVIEFLIDENFEVPWPTLLRVDTASRDLPVSRLLTANDRNSRPITFGNQQQESGSSLLANLASEFQNWIPGLSWLAIGFQHIIPWGLDHIVFLLGLFFLSTRLSTLLYQVSCFTVAHSITLGLATLGMISVPANIVEPLIAASIVFIAVDNLYSDFLARWRLGVVTLFGLLHGLGFASALSGLLMPSENFFMALLMFNVGVELGQIAVLIAAFAAVGWLRGWTAYTERIARPATVTIAGVGAYWLLKRVAF